jgi:hypothetical protein
MLDLQTQTPLTLNQARRLHFLRGRTGNQISLDSIYRWASKGIRGVVLETRKIGGTTFTTAEAVGDFIERLNDPTRSNARTSSLRRREIAEVNKRLDKKGI